MFSLILFTPEEIFLGIYTILALQVIFILYTFFKSIKKLRLFSKKEEWSKKIDEEIFLQIFEEKTGFNPAFTNDIKSKNFKLLFIEKLNKALISFSGLSNSKIANIYNIYKLDKFAFKRLDHKNPYQVATAIRNVTFMNIEKAIPKIEQLLLHPNNTVQEEAMFSLVKFLGYDGLEIVNNSNIYLSDWQQIKLLSTLNEIPFNHNENIIKWLNSTNESVVIITLKIIKKFQLLEFEDYILKHLTGFNPKITAQAIKTFDTVNSSNTAHQLIELYPYQSTENQLELLRIIKNIGTDDQKYFLIGEAIHHPNLTIKKRAIKALLNIISTEETFTLLEATENPKTKEILDLIILESK